MKIAMIGAGSIAFARRLLVDILSFPELQESTVALMDVDEARLTLSRQWAHKVVQQEHLPTQIMATTDRRAALDGADYVIIMILVGGVAAERSDIEIPAKYGILQGVGDTLGPGGVVRFLRTAPALRAICRDMEELCPQALMLNYTNPMAMNCWLMNQATNVKNVGLCHSVQGTAEQLGRYMGLNFAELSYWVAGINHMAWYLKLERGGQDVYPQLRQALADPAIYAKDPVRFEIMRHFHYFVTESTTHMSEYVPYFRTSGERLAAFGLRPTRDIDGRVERQGSHLAELQQALGQDEPFPFTRTNEYCAHIIHAMQTNTPYRMNGNVNNSGLITNLPNGCCVEVPCLVDNQGVHPCHIGDLPPQLAALNRSNIHVQELAVKAALKENPEAAIQAVALDPLTASLLPLADIRKMVLELLAASSPWLSPTLHK